ncbi:MAG: DUF4153 domain-containing protein [Pyrinomonadaceae bacterium]
MNERTRIALQILKYAVVIGILGNILLRATPWGLNVFLFIAAFVLVFLVLARLRRPELLNSQNWALLGAMLFFGAMFVWRDSIELRIFDTFAIVSILGVLILPTFGVTARVAGASHYIAGLIWAGINSALAPAAILSADIDWEKVPGVGRSKHLFSVLRGLAIALPLVLIFGALFVAADAAYEQMVQRVFNIAPETVFTHVLLTAIFAWLSAGYFRLTIFGGVPVANAASEPEASEKDASSAETPVSSSVDKIRAEEISDRNILPGNLSILEHINKSDPPNTAETPNKNPSTAPAEEKKKWDWANFDNTSIPRVFTLGAVESIIILGLVNLLFLSFVIVQLPYLFGGIALVQSTPDFKLAEYARRGFGELVAAAALVLPMLLVSHWLLRKETQNAEKIYRILAALQIALLFVIMASAAQRLLLLTGSLGYGMTTVRFYPMVFMVWLAVVFAWFAVTVLRNARNHFAWGALWSAIVILAATNLMNPDAFIARTNIQLMQQGREFDAHYNSSELSDDALPTVLNALPSLNADGQCLVKWKLHDRLIRSRSETDVRSWNWSRYAARQRLEANHFVFDEHAGCPAWMPFPETAGE